MLWSEYSKSEYDKKESHFEKRLGNLSSYAKKIISKKNYDKRVKELAGYLNGIYYPPDGGNEIAKKIEEFIGIVYQNWQVVYKDYLKEDVSEVAKSIGTDPELLLDKQKNRENKVPTIQDIYERSEKFEEKSKNTRRITQKLINDYQNLKKQRIDFTASSDNVLIAAQTYAYFIFLSETERALESFYNSLGIEGNKKLTSYGIEVVKEKDGTINFSKLLKNLNLARVYLKVIEEFYRILERGGNPFSMKDYGDIFEWSLEAISDLGQKTEEEITETVINEEFVKRMAGNTTGGKISEARDERHSKGRLPKLGELNNIDIVEKKETKKDGTEKTKKYIKKTKNGVSVEIQYIEPKSPYEGRQIKMDLEFKMPKSLENLELGNESFRVSAKNWDSMSRDFGETSVFNALVRSNPKYFVETYPILVGKIKTFSKDKSSIHYSHQLAKYSLLLDILMGFSQKKGYADTVVINDRSKQEIKVFAIQEVLEKIEPEGIQLSDYDDSDISDKFSDILAVSDNLDQYKDLAYRKMLEIKVALRYSDIKDKIKVYGKKNEVNNS